MHMHVPSELAAICVAVGAQTTIVEGCLLLARPGLVLLSSGNVSLSWATLLPSC